MTDPHAGARATDTPLAIDGDITRIVDQWAAAIGGPDHERAARKLDDLLVDLTASRKFRDRILHECCEEIERGWMQNRDYRVVDKLSARYPELSLDLYQFFALVHQQYLGASEMNDDDETLRRIAHAAGIRSSDAKDPTEREEAETTLALVREVRWLRDVVSAAWIARTTLSTEKLNNV